MVKFKYWNFKTTKHIDKYAHTFITTFQIRIIQNNYICKKYMGHRCVYTATKYIIHRKILN